MGRRFSTLAIQTPHFVSVKMLVVARFDFSAFDTVT